jgi:hypothetical protein
MPDLVLVDTDVLVDVGRGVREAADYLADLRSCADLGISTITEMELIAGCRNKPELAQLTRFLSPYGRVKLTAEISDMAVTLMQEYRLSHGLLTPDALIAATVRVTGRRLLTRNRKHYDPVPGISFVPYPERVTKS